MASEVESQQRNGVPDGATPAPKPSPRPEPEPSGSEADPETPTSARGRLLTVVTRSDPTTPEASHETSPVVSPVTSPPYWVQSHSRPLAAHNGSVESLPTGHITLQDNDNDGPPDDRNAACWARSVRVVDHVTVNGSATNIGAFVVWNIKVETLNGSYMNIRKRYSEFDDFRARLVQTFPNFEAAVPELPPKSLISKFRPRFLEKRRAGLQYFLNCILLNPEFSGSPVLKEFLFS